MSAAFAIREEMNDIEEAPGKTWFWELERAVIDAGRCVQCGACIAACPSDSLGIGPDDLPKLVKMCTGCSLCWDFCPRGGLRYEVLGELAIETARRQDGKTASSGVGARHAVPETPLAADAACRGDACVARSSASASSATATLPATAALPATAPLYI